MKKSTIILLSTLLTAGLCSACGNKAATDAPANGAPEAKASAEANADTKDANADAKDADVKSDVEANGEADADDDNSDGKPKPAARAKTPTAPGVECTERTCQCGSSACTKNETCSDGACYCGNQAYIDENYACKDVNVAPIALGPESYVRKYVCQSAEGCSCGDTTCPQNAACENGQCVCGSTPLAPENTGYACNMVSENHYDWTCRESSGCPCGSITAAIHMGCNGKNATCLGSPVPGRGLACRPKEFGIYKYHLACFKDECDCYGQTIKKDEVCYPLNCDAGYTQGPKGCMCGSEVGDKDGFICTAGKGGKPVKECEYGADTYCKCGENVCEPFQVCKKGECVDRITMKVQENTTDYEFDKGFWQCTNSEGCTCGKPSKNGKPNCETGKFCINGMCRKDRYFRKLGEKVLYYKLNESKDAARGDDYIQKLWAFMFIDEAEPLCTGDWKTLYQEVDGQKVKLCEDARYSNMTIGEFLANCGVGPQPANAGTLYCYIDYIFTKKPDEDTGWAPSVVRVKGWAE